VERHVRHILYAIDSVDTDAYLYDTYSNDICRLAPGAVPALEADLRAERAGTTLADESALGRVRRRGLLHPCDVRRMEFYSSSRLRQRVSTCVSQLTLEVTQICNLRCKYCTFTYDAERTAPSAGMMPVATARKAIDEFDRLSSQATTRTLSFWGGEPLTNYPLIRAAVAYARARLAGPLRVSFTTNATLITQRVASFLANIDCELLVSLDGPETIHDQQRLRVNLMGRRPMRPLSLVSGRSAMPIRTTTAVRCDSTACSAARQTLKSSKHSSTRTISARSTR
jgi:uncharacterized protein